VQTGLRTQPDPTATAHTTGRPATRRDQIKLTVFGATGGIGGHVVRQALAAGHHVTAVVRDPARFDVSHPALEVATVPGLTNPDGLRAALEGSNVAISGVGPRGRKDGPVASSTTRGMLRAMEASGVRRFVAVSAVPVGSVPEGESFLNRRILAAVHQCRCTGCLCGSGRDGGRDPPQRHRVDDRATAEAREQARDRQVPHRRRRKCAARLRDLPPPTWPTSCSPRWTIRRRSGRRSGLRTDRNDHEPTVSDDLARPGSRLWPLPAQPSANPSGQQRRARSRTQGAAPSLAAESCATS
jgi:hypothetical protein